LTAFKGARAVIHSAAQISISPRNKDLVWKTNVLGTENVLKAAAESGVEKLIHVSSIHAFKDNRTMVSEESGLIEKEGSTYDRSKAVSIKIVLNHPSSPEKVIICPTALLGPYDFKPSFIGRFLISLARKRVPALVSGGFDWVDVRDVARAIVKAIEKGKGIYITGGMYLPIFQLARLWCEIVQVKPPEIIFPLPLAIGIISLFFPIVSLIKPDLLLTPEALAALRWKSPISTKKAREELDYRVRPIEETLVDTYRWFKENGYF